MAKNKSISTRKKWLLGILVLLVVVAAGALVFHLTHKSRPSYSTNAKTTSTAPSAQNDFQGDNQKTVPETVPEANASGADQNGSIDTIPPSSQWTKSDDGTSIIVYGPAKNSSFASGDLVFGAANSGTVSYRLSDSVSGLLTSGTASVVDGKFSIKLSFSTSADSGNIEIFNQKDPYSPESNNVLVPVRFK